MSNNEAPERIWLSDSQPAATWTDFQQIGYTEYIRADLHAERIAELESERDIALGALADIGLNTDMTRKVMQHKAMRIYRELQPDE